MNNLNKRLCDEWNLNKSINPITKRNIKINGPVYNNLEKNCNNIGNVKNSRDKKKESLNICDEWFKNPNINPETKKSIKKNGQVYKKLFKLCDEKKVKSSEKVSKKLSSSDSSKTKQLCDQWIKNPTINPETGYKIKIDGPKYNYFKSLCLNKKVKTPSPIKSKTPLLSKSSYNTPLSSFSQYESIISKPNSISSNKSISKLSEEELKNIFDKDPKLKKSIEKKLSELNEIKKSKSSSYKSLSSSKSSSSFKSAKQPSKSSSKSSSSIINPYFYHDDNTYNRKKKSSEEIELESVIIEEIKKSISDDVDKKRSKDSSNMDKGFLGKLFNIFGF